MIRVAAIDDSALIRGFLEGVLGSEPDLELLALGSNGAEAIDIVRHHQPDVLVLDLEMPGMGGLDVLRTLMVECPLRVLVYTSHQGKSLAAYQALRLGAVEFLNKPEDIIDPVKYDTARAKLVERIRAVAAIEFNIHKPDPTVAPRNQRPTECPFGAIALGATSGAATSLLPVMKAFPSTMPVPVFLFPQLNISMAAGYADWLNSQISIRAVIVADKMPVSAGTVHVTCPGRRFRIARSLWSADPNFASDPTAGGLDASLLHLVEVYESKLLVVILNGLSVDGLEGLAAVRRAGGTVLILEPASDAEQDLPASAISQGLASEVVPLPHLGSRVLDVCNIRRL